MLVVGAFSAQLGCLEKTGMHIRSSFAISADPTDNTDELL